jgi:hypothetical protein
MECLVVPDDDPSNADSDTDSFVDVVVEATDDEDAGSNGEPEDDGTGSEVSDQWSMVSSA